MKLVHMTFRHEFAEAVEVILERHEVRDFVRYPMIHGRDRDGKHYLGKVFPGSMTVVQAILETEKTEALMDELRSFQEEKESHAHLRAVVLDVESFI